MIFNNIITTYYVDVNKNIIFFRNNLFFLRRAKTPANQQVWRVDKFHRCWRLPRFCCGLTSAIQKDFRMRRSLSAGQRGFGGWNSRDPAGLRGFPRSPDIWRLPHFLTASPSSCSPGTGYIQGRFSAASVWYAHFEQSVTTFASRTPLPPFNGWETLYGIVIPAFRFAFGELRNSAHFVRFITAFHFFAFFAFYAA